MSVHLRPAQPTDAGTTGTILWQFQAETDWMPDLYSAAQTIAFCGAMIDRGWVTVAVVAGRVEGFIARDGEEICALYLARQATRRGIGRKMLDDAKATSGRLWLRAFRANSGALEFYRRQGFAEVGRTDGAQNEENLPDIHFLWQREGGG